MNFAATDAETFLIAPGAQAAKSVCWVADVAGRDELLHSRFDYDEVRDRLSRTFQARPVGANVAYDACVAMRDFPELRETIWACYDDHRAWDVLHAEKLIDLAKGRLGWHPGPDGMVKAVYSLGDIVERRFGHKMQKEDGWRLRFGTLYDTRISEFPSDAREYAMGDLGWTRAVLQAQLQEYPELLVDVGRQTRAAFWAYLMTCRGFMTDPVWVNRFEQSIAAESDEIRKTLEPLGLIDHTGKRNTKAAMARAEAVAKEKGIKVQMTGDADDEGQVDLSKAACAKLEDPALIQYSKFSGNKTMLAKIRAIKDASDAGRPIQSRFEVLVNTGRMACQGGRPKKKADLINRLSFSFQLHNLNRKSDLRGCFVPRPGYVLGSLDFGQFELCAWAQVCRYLFGFSKLGDLLNAGIDVHCELGARMYDRSYEWVFANRKTDPLAKKARQASKGPNFGLPGMMGAKGLIVYAETQYQTIFTMEEAEGFIRVWRELRPEHKPYFEHIRRCVERDGYIVQLGSQRIRGGVGMTDGANSLFQGLAADAKKAAGCELSRACYTGRDSFGNTFPALFGSYLVNEIHDEFIFEFIEDRGHEAAVEATFIMEREAQKWMPDVPPKVEPALMRRWLKDASPEYKDGRLVPWEPKA